MHWLDQDTAAWLISCAEADGGWQRNRHKQHATTDIEVALMPAVRDWVSTVVGERLLPVLGELFGVESRRLSVEEVFIVKYSAQRTAEGEQTAVAEQAGEMAVPTALTDQMASAQIASDGSGLKMHRDGHPLSFNVLLSDPAGFEGGGTSFATIGVYTLSAFLAAHTALIQLAPCASYLRVRSILHQRVGGGVW